MLRTAYSQILNSSRDFSTAVFDGQGRLAAQAEHVPIHVGALPWAVASIADFFKGRIEPGDMFLLNDPYHGNNHLPDLTVLLPVFVGDQLTFWSINRAHQHDIGGATHGAYNAAATEIWQEGIRITPLKLYDRGRAARRRHADGGDQCPPPARLPGRPPRHDRLGARGRASPAQARGRVRRGDGHRHRGRDPGRRRAAGAAVHPRAGRTACIAGSPSSTTTATASATSTSAPPSPSAATGSSWT